MEKKIFHVKNKQLSLLSFSYAEEDFRHIIHVIGRAQKRKKTSSKMMRV